MAMTITELRAAVKDLREYIPALEQELGLAPTVYGLMPRNLKDLAAEYKALTAKADELENMTPVSAPTAPAPRTTADILANATRPVGAEKPVKSAVSGKLPLDVFVVRAIERLHKPPKNPKPGVDYSKPCVHTVYSGVWAQFLSYYGFTKEQGQDAIKTLEQRKVIKAVPVKGGYMWFKYADAPKRTFDEGERGKAALDAILA